MAAAASRPSRDSWEAPAADSDLLAYDSDQNSNSDADGWGSDLDLDVEAAEDAAEVAVAMLCSPAKEESARASLQQGSSRAAEPLPEFLAEMRRDNAATELTKRLFALSSDQLGASDLSEMAQLVGGRHPAVLDALLSLRQPLSDGGAHQGDQASTATSADSKGACEGSHVGETLVSAAYPAVASPEYWGEPGEDISHSDPAVHGDLPRPAPLQPVMWASGAQITGTVPLSAASEASPTSSQRAAADEQPRSIAPFPWGIASATHNFANEPSRNTSPCGRASLVRMFPSHPLFQLVDEVCHRANAPDRALREPSRIWAIENRRLWDKFVRQRPQPPQPTDTRPDSQSCSHPLGETHVWYAFASPSDAATACFHGPSRQQCDDHRSMAFARTPHGAFRALLSMQPLPQARYAVLCRVPDGPTRLDALSAGPMYPEVLVEFGMASSAERPPQFDDVLRSTRLARDYASRFVQKLRSARLDACRRELEALAAKVTIGQLGWSCSACTAMNASLSAMQCFVCQTRRLPSDLPVYDGENLGAQNVEADRAQLAILESADAAARAAAAAAAEEAAEAQATAAAIDSVNALQEWESRDVGESGVTYADTVKSKRAAYFNTLTARLLSRADDSAELPAAALENYDRLLMWETPCPRFPEYYGAAGLPMVDLDRSMLPIEVPEDHRVFRLVSAMLQRRMGSTPIRVLAVDAIWDPVRWSQYRASQSLSLGKWPRLRVLEKHAWATVKDPARLLLDPPAIWLRPRPTSHVVSLHSPEAQPWPVVTDLLSGASVMTLVLSRVLRGADDDTFKENKIWADARDVYPEFVVRAVDLSSRPRSPALPVEIEGLFAPADGEQQQQQQQQQPSSVADAGLEEPEVICAADGDILDPKIGTAAAIESRVATCPAPGRAREDLSRPVPSSSSPANGDTSSSVVQQPPAAEELARDVDDVDASDPELVDSSPRSAHSESPETSGASDGDWVDVGADDDF